MKIILALCLFAITAQAQRVCSCLIPLVGTWTNSNGVTWQFRADYRVTATNQTALCLGSPGLLTIDWRGSPEVWAFAITNGNQLSMTNRAGTVLVLRK